MNIPKQIKIGALTFRVKSVTPAPKDEDGQDCYGTIDYPKGLIELDGGMTEDRAWSVFWHEALHGMSDEAGVRLTEKQTLALGKTLSAFMVDNGITVKGVKGEQV